MKKTKQAKFGSEDEMKPKRTVDEILEGLLTLSYSSDMTVDPVPLAKSELLKLIEGAELEDKEYDITLYDDCVNNENGGYNEGKKAQLEAIRKLFS